mmetsp:Transcript_6620/g.21377  ORF Transcript_6620/g.21377 Transcript_6620/m.21377 type:complete len:91 (-) Transcript_6620:1302-1574(-)
MKGGAQCQFERDMCVDSPSQRRWAPPQATSVDTFQQGGMVAEADLASGATRKELLAFGRGTSHTRKEDITRGRRPTEAQAAVQRVTRRVP